MHWARLTRTSLNEHRHAQNETKEATKLGGLSGAVLCQGVGTPTEKANVLGGEPQAKSDGLKEPELVQLNFSRVKPFASPFAGKDLRGLQDFIKILRPGNAQPLSPRAVDVKELTAEVTELRHENKCLRSALASAAGLLMPYHRQTNGSRWAGRYQRQRSLNRPGASSV